jgi:hypothetical protein
MRKFPEINLGLEMIIIFIVTFSAYSNVFWSGYPSFQWGVIHFLIALLIIAKKEDSGATQMSFYFAACVLTFYSYQLIAVPLFVSLFYFFIKLKKIEIIQLFSRPLNLYMNVATLVLLISFIEKTINVRTIVLNTGGIETISLSLLICGVIFLHLGILGVDQMLSSFKNLIVVLYCSIACSVGLSLYAIRSTGSPTYYTQKFNYLLLLLLMILSLIIIFWPSRRKTTIKKKLHNFSSLFLVLCVWVTFSNRAFSTAFMGGSLQVLQTSIMEHRGLYMNRGANCLITYFSEFYIRDRNPRHARIFLPSQKISGDIESRWLNALDLRLNEPLYELFIPLGQAKEGIERVRVIEDWQAKHPNYSIEFYSDNSIDESLNSKFKSTRINC